MAESVLGRPYGNMETEVQRLKDAPPGSDPMHKQSPNSIAPETQGATSHVNDNDEEEDSIERDLRLMGIIVPKPEKPVSKNRRPKRSLKITLTGIKSDSLHQEEKRTADDRRLQEEGKQTDACFESRTAETITTSQTSPHHEGELAIASTSQDTLDASIIEKSTEPTQQLGFPSKSASSIVGTGLPTDNKSTVTASSNKRKRLSNGRWASVKQPKSKPTSFAAEEDVIRANGSSSTPPEMKDNADAIAQTRSGRKIHRPEVLVLEDHRRVRVKRESDHSGSGHLASARSHNQRRSSGMFPVSHSARQRSGRSGTQEPIHCCSRCERTSAPSGNLLVYCDKCNRGWHRFCHNPPVNDQVTKDKQTPWVCMICKPTVVKSDPRNISRRRVRKRRQTAPTSTPGSCLPSRESSGSQFSYEERRGYLASLSHTSLVNLLLDISTSSPDLLIFPQNLRSLPSTSFLPNSTPSTVSKQAPRSDDYVGVSESADRRAVSDLTYHDDDFNKDDDEGAYVEEHRLYPEPGNGFKLPPIEEDMHMLLEDTDCAAFSHSLHGPAAMTARQCNATEMRKSTDAIGTAG